METTTPVVDTTGAESLPGPDDGPKGSKSPGRLSTNPRSMRFGRFNLAICQSLKPIKLTIKENLSIEFLSTYFRT